MVKINLDPEKFNLMRFLRPLPKTAEQKRYGTFNRRMIAASIDSLFITMLMGPLIDYYYVQHYGEPTVDIIMVITQANEVAARGGDAVVKLYQGLKEGGYIDRMVVNTKWQYYFYAIYSVVCWHFWNATPGKLICRLQVVDAKTGGRMSDWQSILRVLAYLPSAIMFGLGFFWIGLNKKRKGWHDYLAGTEVVLTSSKERN